MGREGGGGGEDAKSIRSLGGEFGGREWGMRGWRGAERMGETV